MPPRPCYGSNPPSFFLPAGTWTRSLVAASSGVSVAKLAPGNVADCGELTLGVGEMGVSVV